MNSPNANDRFYKELWPHRAAVLRVARLLTHSDSDADDLAQDAMMRAYRGIKGLVPGTNAKAWLMTILRHAYSDHLSSTHKELSLDALELEPADQHKSPEDVGAWGNAQQTLAAFSDAEIIRALKTLPEDIRWTLLLVDVQGLDDNEAADVLAVPEGTVKSRLHRGRRMLRDRLLPLLQRRQSQPPLPARKS